MYDKVMNQARVAWNLTMGLYWIRPWSFPTLDGRSREYIETKLSIQIRRNGPQKRCNAANYLELMVVLEARFQEETFSVHSFPELSLVAWYYDSKPPSDDEEPFMGGQLVHYRFIFNNKTLRY